MRNLRAQARKIENTVYRTDVPVPASANPIGWNGHHGNRYFMKVRSDIVTAPMPNSPSWRVSGGSGLFIWVSTVANPDLL